MDFLEDGSEWNEGNTSSDLNGFFRLKGAEDELRWLEVEFEWVEENPSLDSNGLFILKRVKEL